MRDTMAERPRKQLPLIKPVKNMTLEETRETIKTVTLTGEGKTPSAIGSYQRATKRIIYTPTKTLMASL